MRTLATVLVVLLVAPAAAFGISCAPGTLLDYVGLGASGCTVGDVTFSDFLQLAIPGAATLIPASAIGVTPVLAVGEAGLAFDVGVAVSSGEFLDTRFRFRVNDTLGGATLAMTGASATGDGAVSVVEEICLGAPFGPACGGAALAPPLGVFAVDGIADLSDSGTFASASLLGVIADVGVDAGETGTAALELVTLRFQTGASTPPAVPGPSPLVLLVAAGAAAGACRRAKNSIGGSR